MAFRDELFAKIGANGEEGETDPYKLIQAGDTEHQNGNTGKATTMYNSAVTNALAKAQKFEEQKQFRSAAEAYYLASLAYTKLGNSDEAKKFYKNVGEQLLAASNMYINTYEEYSSGVICASLGGLIYVLLKDFEKAKSVYQEALQSIENKANEGKIQIGKQKLVQIVWVVGYVLQAIQEVSHEALQEAQQLISSQIRPTLSKMKLAGVEPLLNQVVEFVLEYFQSQIKLPSISIASEMSKDLVVNQMFEIKFDLMNTGEGVATSARFELSIPEGIEVVDGQTIAEYESLPPNHHEQLILHLRYHTSTPEDVKISLKGKLTYFDMLKNQQVQYVGPYELEINAESKKEKLTRELQAELERAEGQKSLELHSELPSVFGAMSAEILKSAFPQLQKYLEEEEYDKIPGAIHVLSILREGFGEFISPSGEKVGDLLNGLNEIKETYAQQKVEEAIEVRNREVESEISALKSNFENEKNEALEKQKQEFSNEIENLKSTHMEEISRLRTDLQSNFEKEKNEIIESHKIEVEEIKKQMKDEIDQNTALMDRKLNAKLSEQEETLRSEFNKQITELNEKNASVVNELRTQFDEEKEQAIKEVEEKLTSEYEEKIKNITSEYEEKLRMQKEQADQQLELKISQLQSKHEQDMKMLREDYEMKLKENSPN